jgi:Peptidase family M23
MKRQLMYAASAVALVVGLGTVPVALASSGSPALQPNPEPLPLFSALATNVMTAPTPVLGTDKRRHLVYEIALLNVTPVPERVDGVDVIDAATGSTVKSYSGPASVQGIMTNAVATHSPTDTLPTSGSGVLWLDVSFAAGQRVPTRLVHRIASTILTEPARHFQLNGARTDVGRKGPVVLGAPLIGAGYVDANGCCGESPHTRALLTIDGQRFLAQRFAIDWVRIDAKGRAFVGDFRNNDSWLIFGDPLIAAASGIVVGVLDTLPENTPPVPLANLTPQNALGNHVIVDIGGGRFALYAHVQTNSVAVHVGQIVHRGEFLGRVGNTGSSTAPHLHFHVTDGPDVLASSGQPYVLDHFRLTGEVLNLDAFADDNNPQPAQVGPAAGPSRRRDQLPLQPDILTFTR